MRLEVKGVCWRFRHRCRPDRMVASWVAVIRDLKCDQPVVAFVNTDFHQITDVEAPDPVLFKCLVGKLEEVLVS